MTSSLNPFRTPAVTHTPTGASSASPSSGSSSAAHASSHNNGSTHGQSSQRPGSGPGPVDTSVNDLLSEELPPAYTPSPNVYEGEATLEVGPRRPFQQTAPVRQQNTSHFPPPSWGPGVSPQSTGWSDFLGHSHREQVGNWYTAAQPPPPVHPDIVGPTRPSSTPPTRMSDFVRDFYTAGGGDGGLYGGSSTQYQNEPVGASSSSSMRYAPPPGAPPNHSGKTGTLTPTSPPSAPNGASNDGRPTDRPVPGHPLLRQGKVLVYPHGFECQKCRNTGYKNFDPSYPCSRCWEKYSKSYTGAITYAPWTSDASSSSSTSLQRPLPVFRSPQSALHQQSASWSGPGAGLSRAATTSRASQPYGNGSDYPGASARTIPIAGGALPMGPFLDRLGSGGGPLGFPPPSWRPGIGPSPSTGNPVVSPGDPRIGGRLCWRCGGRGKTSFLIFDEETCSICRGIGRTFV